MKWNSAGAYKWYESEVTNVDVQAAMRGTPVDANILKPSSVSFAREVGGLPLTLDAAHEAMVNQHPAVVAALQKRNSIRDSIAADYGTIRRAQLAGDARANEYNTASTQFTRLRDKKRRIELTNWHNAIRESGELMPHSIGVLKKRKRGRPSKADLELEAAELDLLQTEDTRVSSTVGQDPPVHDAMQVTANVTPNGTTANTDGLEGLSLKLRNAHQRGELGLLTLPKRSFPASDDTNTRQTFDLASLRPDSRSANDDADVRHMRNPAPLSRNRQTASDDANLDPMIDPALLALDRQSASDDANVHMIDPVLLALDSQSMGGEADIDPMTGPAMVSLVKHSESRDANAGSGDPLQDLLAPLQNPDVSRADAMTQLLRIYDLEFVAIPLRGKAKARRTPAAVRPTSEEAADLGSEREFDSRAIISTARQQSPSSTQKLPAFAQLLQEYVKPQTFAEQAAALQNETRPTYRGRVLRELRPRPN